MQFSDLKLIDPLLRAVRAEGYTEPTPIQTQAIPHVLAGRDLIGCAQTGTGKTAAFALPLLQELVNTTDKSARKKLRVLVLSPTRELASQIAESFMAYGKHTGLKTIIIFGGVGQQPQVQAIRSGADILVATPGRLLDLMNQGLIRLNTIDMFVLDEADRMLDMGFIHDVKKIIAALPTKRQTLLFSATMPEPIQTLANEILIKPVYVEVTPPATTVEKIAQSVYFVDKKDKRRLLEFLLRDRSIKRTLVFTRTKHGANKLAEQLEDAGIGAEAIHGNKSQTARERALANFKSGATRVLVATDIAARGIDVDGVTHVINFDLPFEPESYVHRIGRTARAGASGIAFSFSDAEEVKLLRDIEKLIRQPVPVVAEHPYVGSFDPSVRQSGGPSRPQQRQQPQRSYDRSSNGGSRNSSNGNNGNRSGSSSRNANGSSGSSSSRPQSQGQTQRQPIAAAGTRPEGDSHGTGNSQRRRRRRRPNRTPQGEKTI